jgi:hypothetical protein
VVLTGHEVILGTTNIGGYAAGTVYNLGTARKILLHVLHAFSGGGTTSLDGAFPESGLTAGQANRFHGVTLFGGAGLNGKAGGGYASSGDGLNPSIGNLAVDAQGNLYGETNRGGALHRPDSCFHALRP